MTTYKPTKAHEHRRFAFREIVLRTSRASCISRKSFLKVAEGPTPRKKPPLVTSQAVGSTLTSDGRISLQSPWVSILPREGEGHFWDHYQHCGQ